MEKNFFVYIFASGENGTLYVGVTSNLPKRVYEHKNKLIEGFTKKYNVDKLVYYENHDSAESAILREKKLKAWRRSWKLDLTYKFNPYWEDLYENIACFS
ncbi:MAG: excinuclease ABC subunit C [Alphaproteobacteria bacterium CG11_big_fil_rev_8_21_14_0_20_39_49]|nr:MAG: excinuclease ABC subunit C [Alphaproteobacteria bacterium CG11_big_fil_rev_8_21_14_0_20_39_49]